MNVPQAVAQKADSAKALVDDIMGKIDQEKDSSLVSMPELTHNAHSDSILLDQYVRVRVYHMKHEMSAYHLQYITSIAIFIMVIVIVVLGLILSYKQFTLTERMMTKSIKIHKQTVGETAQQPGFSDSTFEVSKDGLKINTAVIGLMILVLSLVFFFLYLKFVYPIDIHQ
ncbi:hypothetical protein GCM10023149_01440 [Mucilaginibacter gynuensis]|uniref:Uncharacterized protein n=2 Tax=Mucilaginibacter gynuensis TaxID=1302236 RepID=A0ABP8FNL1_9SPHI